MSFDAIFSGYPSGLASPSVAPALGVDTTNFNAYLNSSNGWVPFAPSTVSKTVLRAQTANVASVLTYAVQVTGLYRVDLYEVSANTATGATLPAITVVYTDVDTTGSITQTLASVGSVSAANVVSQGTFLVNAGPVSNIVIATTSYAAGSGTALSYNIKARITYLG